MEQMIAEEIHALQAMFCLPGEVEVQEEDVTINTVLDVGVSNGPQHVQVQIMLHIGPDYPESLPEISVFSQHVNREMVNRVKSLVSKNNSYLIGEPMLISLISSIKEHLTDELESEVKMQNKEYLGTETVLSNNDIIVTSILHIDHMRSKNKYCKTLEKWASELILTGRILFYSKLILVILQGDQDSIKDFIVRLKTVSVDVDSRGHSCKERMMTVLHEQQNSSSQINRFEAFRRMELQDKDELGEVFRASKLDSIYKTHVTRLLGEKK